MIDDPHLVAAREFERSVRHALINGCSADIAILDRLCSDAFASARAALKEAFDSEQFRERAQVIAALCTRRVRDTANLRFRARFRSYAESVYENEARLIAQPRRVALPRLHLRAVQPSIVWRDSRDDFLESWMRDLTTELHVALKDAVGIAIETVIKRVIASVARSRTARVV